MIRDDPYTLFTCPYRSLCGLLMTSRLLMTSQMQCAKSHLWHERLKSISNSLDIAYFHIHIHDRSHAATNGPETKHRKIPYHAMSLFELLYTLCTLQICTFIASQLLSTLSSGNTIMDSRLTIILVNNGNDNVWFTEFPQNVDVFLSVSKHHIWLWERGTNKTDVSN